MNEEGQVVLQDLQDVHSRLLECYELVEELRHHNGLSPEINEALAGLHYSVAKATQDAWRLLDNSSLWEES